MSKIVSLYLKVVLVLFPLAYLPVIADMYGLGKIWWWLVLALIGLVLWAGDMILAKKNEITVNGGMWLMLGLLVWGLVSWFKESVGVRERVLWSDTGLATLAGATMWYFLLLQLQLTKEELTKVLRIVGMIAAVAALVVFLVPEKVLPIVWPKNNPVVVITGAWSLVGSLLGEIVLLAFGVIMSGRQVYLKMKKNEVYTMEAAMTGFMGLGLFLDIYRSTKAGWGIMDLTSAWIVATEAFKQLPIWGVGLGNYAEAFSLFRPSSFNMTALWATSPVLSAMTWLQLWSELGIGALVLMVLLVNYVLRIKEKKFGFWMALIAVTAWLLLPFSMMGLLVMILALVMAGEKKKAKLYLAMGESRINVMPWIMAVAAVGVGIMGLIKSGATVLAENYQRKALVAASQNDGNKTYDWQRKLVTANPNMADYRQAYSQTNLAIANTYLTNKDLSDEDKQKVSVLLQQAVTEAKAAVALDNMNGMYWYNLAVIYKNMIGVVDGAADWAVQAYQQAILLSPSNPTITLDYGGLLYAAGKYEDADRVFEQTVTSKANYPNGWYNWAYTAKKLNKIDLAVQRLSQAVALVPATTGDYDKASKELDDWKKEYEEAVKKAQAAQKDAQATQTANTQEKQPETLKTPEALPTGNAAVNVPTGNMQPPEVTPTQALSQPTVVPTMAAP